MKILSIVVYPFDPNSKILSTSLGSQFLWMDPIEKIIRQKLKPLADEVKNKYGIHKLKFSEGLFYACVDHKKISIIAVDTDLTRRQQFALFEKIDAASNTQSLFELICSPEDAVFVKIDDIKNNLAEVKDIVMTDLDKILERHETIENLKNRTDFIANESKKFNHRAIELRRRSYCPNLFSFFDNISMVKNYFWPTQDETVEYDYYPLKPK